MEENEGTQGRQNMEDVLGALAMFMEQNRRNSGSHEATKALKGVVDKVGRFEGKNISSFLRAYVCEFEVHQVEEGRMMQTFDLAVVPEIRERIQEIREDANVTSWATFEERLRDEYFDEDSERMSKKSFLDWVEQQPGSEMGPSELLREFERKFIQLPLAERRLLETRKAELFLQATDSALQDRLLLLLGDRNTEGGFTNDWKKVEETVTLVAKQQRVKTRGLGGRMEPTSRNDVKAPATTLPPSSPSTVSKGKTLDEGTLEELMRGMRELKVEMGVLTKNTKSNSSRPSEGPKGFVMRCIWCDDPNHRRGDCGSYADALKSGVVTFKEGRIRDAATDEPLDTNFGRGGMRKLMDDKLGRNNLSRGKEVESYTIGAEHKMERATHVSREVMVRGAQTIRSLTGWDDPVDATTIKVYLMSEHGEKKPFDASVEVKRGRSGDEEEGDEPTNKRKSTSDGQVIPEEGPANNTRQRHAPRPESTSRQGADVPLPKEKWEERMNSKKGPKEGDNTKGKGKAPAYKLQSDIESSIDLKGILEEKILDAKIEFTLREVLGIAKKGFHELIIDVIKRKRQMTAETVMVEALDSVVTKEEDDEIGQMFALRCDSKGSSGKINEGEVISLKSDEEKRTNESQINEGVMEVQVTQCGIDTNWRSAGDVWTTYTHPFWARATPEARVKIGGLGEPILALIDHGSEINIVSKKIYEKCKWPIDTNHGWVLRAANDGRDNLYGACPAVGIKIGDVEVEQNFFVQNQGSYQAILGQPYITATRMETKVLDDGSQYAKIRSLDGRRSIQFLTVRPDHERHRDQLRDTPMVSKHDDFLDF